MPIAILYRDEIKEYSFGEGHPFQGERFAQFYRFLRHQLPENDNYRIIEADWASDEDLLLICEKEYMNATIEFYKAAYQGMEFPRTFYRFHSGDNVPLGKPGKLEEAARLIVGQAKKACDLVLGGEFKKAVSIGGGLHHAKPGYGEGFCLYNDVAFCGKYLLQNHGLQRVLILDTDAHAGNGTADYFYHDSRVLFIDLHQDPRTLYPGSGFAFEIGHGEGKGFTVNVPMPVYAGDESYKLVFEEIVQPVAEEFQPEIVVRNGGSDPHFNDGLTSLGLSIEGLRMIGRKTREIAELCQGKSVDLITSGYNRDVLPHAWLSLISGLAGIDMAIEEPEAPARRVAEDAVSLAETGSVIEGVESCLKDYWKSLR